MNHEHLEKRLRKPLEKTTPRPGFEQRLQTLAREQQTSRTKSSFLWLAVPTLAAVCVLFFIMSADTKTAPSLTSTSITPQSQATELPELPELPFNETSLEDALALQEALSFGKDLQRTTDFLVSALPSISISTQAP